MAKAGFSIPTACWTSPCDNCQRLYYDIAIQWYYLATILHNTSICNKQTEAHSCHAIVGKYIYLYREHIVLHSVPKSKEKSKALKELTFSFISGSIRTMLCWFFIHFASIQKGSEDPFVPTKVIKAKKSKHSSLCHGHYHSCQRKVN